MTPEVRSSLVFDALQNEDQVEVLRRLRNSGRSGLFDRRRISAEEQAQWWSELRPEYRGRIWLVRRVSDELPCAYCSLLPRVLAGVEDEESRTWITLVVAPRYRGHGIGTAIYAIAPSLVKEIVWAAMWRTNVASYRAACRAGYVDAPTFSGPETRVVRSAL